jgi:hypothetical protein
MTETAQQMTEPPKIRRSVDGKLDNNSVADALEWFLNYDERTARMRHPMIEELFQWKQQDDAANGVGVYPFENAEARFAIGSIQALAENNSEPLLKLWITDVLNALQEAKNANAEITEANNLDAKPELSPMAKSEKLITNAEKRLYLSSCWLEALCTAEARFLGWVYQELYGKPFQP